MERQDAKCWMKRMFLILHGYITWLGLMPFKSSSALELRTNQGSTNTDKNFSDVCVFPIPNFCASLLKPKGCHPFITTFVALCFIISTFETVTYCTLGRRITGTEPADWYWVEVGYHECVWCYRVMRKRTRARWGAEKWVNEGWWRWLGTRSNLLQRGPNRDMRKQKCVCVYVFVCEGMYMNEPVATLIVPSPPLFSVHPPTHSSTLFFSRSQHFSLYTMPKSPSHFLTSSPTPHSTNLFIPLPLCPFQGRPRYNPSLWASQHVSHQATVLRAGCWHSLSLIEQGPI